MHLCGQGLGLIFLAGGDLHVYILLTGDPLHLAWPYPLQSTPSLGLPFWGHFANINDAAAANSQKALQPT